MTGSPVPPPADDQVREAIARHLWDEFGDPASGYDSDDYWRARADELLASPAVSRLVDKARADELRLLAQKFYESRQRWSPNTLGDWMLDRADVISPPARSSVRLTEGN